MRLPAAVLCLAPMTAFAAEPDTLAGAELFDQFCTGCHGESATGDGPMAQILTIRPADLTQLSASNDGAFPVFRVIRQIDGRDPMLVHGGTMPLFGELFDFPDSAIAAETGQPIVTSQALVDIVGYLMSIQAGN